MATSKKKRAAKPKAKTKTKTRAAPPKRTRAPKRSSTPKRRRARIERVAFTLFQIEDSKRARAFYEGVLGLARGLASPDGTWTEYDLPGGGCLALFRHPAGTFSASGGASIALEVEDLDETNAHLEAADVRYVGKMVRGPHCRMSSILDSEGNSIILHQLDKR